MGKQTDLHFAMPVLPKPDQPKLQMINKTLLLSAGLFLVGGLVAFEPMFVSSISFLGRVILIGLLIISIVLINIKKSTCQ
jgi:hypothetical protein